jgi:hypothetical protein
MDQNLAPFHHIEASADGFEGMMDAINVALFDCFLRFQREQSITGNLLEFGVFRGKSAAVILHHVGNGESLGLVEVDKNYPQFDQLRAISPRFRFFNHSSESAFMDKDFIAFAKRGFRFSHHDASHAFDNVREELEFIEKRMIRGGLVALDDFCNLNYSQVMAAYFSHKYRRSSRLEILLIAGCKCYLCAKEDFSLYARFVVGPMLERLRVCGRDCRLARTEDHPDHRAFFLEEKLSPNQDTFYATSIFGQRYYRIVGASNNSRFRRFLPWLSEQVQRSCEPL